MESTGASVKETEGKATPEQFRITYEARQIVINNFDEQKEEADRHQGAKRIPVERHPHCECAHGRLHNICPEGNQQTFKHNPKTFNTMFKHKQTR
jgi:hypothetical protein